MISSTAMKPRLLDLFCGAGGAARGYQRAGFYVIGVDHHEQPRYAGDEFIQADVRDFVYGDWSPWNFAAVHASPPCQAFTAYKRTGNVGPSPDLIAKTRELLHNARLPYVIENVAGAPLHGCVIRICGTQFDPPMKIQRHRFFETNWLAAPPMWPCRHKLNGADNYPGGRSVERTGHSRGKVRATMEIGSWDIPLRDQQQAMGIDWMTLGELSEAIPPAYTEFIGIQLMALDRLKMKV